MHHRTVVDRSGHRTNPASSRSLLILRPRTSVASRRRWKPRGGSQRLTCQTRKKMNFGHAAVLPPLVGQASLRPSQTCWGLQRFVLFSNSSRNHQKHLKISWYESQNRDWKEKQDGDHFFRVSVQCPWNVTRRNIMEFKRFHLILLGYF